MTTNRVGVFNVEQMIPILRQLLVLAWSSMAVLHAPLALSANTNSNPSASIEFSRSPDTVVVSFREIYPEFADQDPTPLLRIYGDGRVVVFHPSYMKQAGQYEMMISRKELNDLLQQLTPVLMQFDPKEVTKEKKAAEDLLLASATDWSEITLFHDADANFSVFEVNIDSYQSAKSGTQRIMKPDLARVWRGLEFDARDYPGIESIQSLRQAEISLRELVQHKKLVRVE